MDKARGILRYRATDGRFSVNDARTLSVVVADYLLREMLLARSYLRGRLLDIGCGTKPFSLIYGPLTDQAYGTEVPFSPFGTMEADILCRAEALPFLSGCFDAVLLTEVLEHTVQPFLALAECSRVIEPSGHVILSVPFVYPLHDWPHDYWRFTRFGLEALCRQAGLRPVYIHTKGGVGATVMSLTIQLAVRATDGITKLFGLSRPIRQLPAIRWLLVMPQRLFLLLAGSLRLPEALQRTSEWMTPGFFAVATKASAPMGDNTSELSMLDTLSDFEDGV